MTGKPSKAPAKTLLQSIASWFGGIEGTKPLKNPKLNWTKKSKGFLPARYHRHTADGSDYAVRFVGDRIFRVGGKQTNRISFLRTLPITLGIPGLATGTYIAADSIYGPEEFYKAKDSKDSKNKPANKAAQTPKENGADDQWYQPLVNGWNTSIDWIKQNPGWAAGIGAGIIGIPLVAWLMTRNKDQDQYQQEQQYEDQNSYKYKYGRH